MRFSAPLHGLRGLAVLYVVVSHLGNGKLWLLPVTHDAIGKVGVWIFFVLSAYLLTGKLVDAMRDSPREVVPYLVHRIFRIFPLYLFVLLLHVWLSGFTMADVGRHLALQDGRWELWAIPVEFTFYLVLPLLAWVSARYGNRTGGLLFALLGLVSLGSGIMRPEGVFSGELSLIPKFVPFAIGGVLSLWRPALPRWSGVASLLGLLVVTVACRALFREGLPLETAPWLGLALGTVTGGLVSSLSRDGWVSRAFGWRPLVFIGEISFSLYLLHMFLIRYAMLLALPPSLIGWGALVVAIAVATATCLLIEKPGIALGRRLSTIGHGRVAVPERPRV